MDDESLAEDPSYRAGVLMGRQQTISDVMAVLLDPARGTAEEKVLALLGWCIQGLEEGKAEVRLMVDALRNEPD